NECSAADCFHKITTVLDVAGVTLAILIFVDYAHELLAHLVLSGTCTALRLSTYRKALTSSAGLELCARTVWFLCTNRFRTVSRELGLYAPLLPSPHCWLDSATFNKDKPSER